MNRRGMIIIGGIAALLLVCALITLSALNSPNAAPLSYTGGNSAGEVRSIPTGVAMMPAPTQAAVAVPEDALPNTGGGGGGTDPYQAQDPTVQQPQQRVVIRNATIGIIVSDPSARISAIGAMAEEMGGWIVSSNTSGFTNNRGEPATRGSIVIRVPAERLDEALAAIRAEVVRVTSENITGQDVTQDFVDTQSQLRNLEAAEAQLQSILEDARRVEDVMMVYNQLVQTRGEIEVARGRLQYYSTAAAFSSITVNVEPEALPPLPVVETQRPGWNPLVTLANALSGLLGLVQRLVDLLIALLVYGCPLALVIGVPALVLRGLRRRA